MKDTYHYDADMEDKLYNLQLVVNRVPNYLYDDAYRVFTYLYDYIEKDSTSAFDIAFMNCSNHDLLQYLLHTDTPLSKAYIIRRAKEFLL